MRAIARTPLIGAAVLAATLLTGCVAQPKNVAPRVKINANPFPSTYARYPGASTLISNVTILDGEGGRIERGWVSFVGGEISGIGAGTLDPHPGMIVIDGTGKTVTPGIIDVHSHLGNYPSPGTPSLSDGNEATSPARPEVWAEHSVWPQDPGFSRALANGGITSLQILPGSAIASMPPQELPKTCTRARPSASRTASTSSTNNSTVQSSACGGVADFPQPTWS